MGTTPGKGRADFWEGGDWNTVCYQCGRKRKASMLKRHWQGYYVCPEHWEPRQPQDFVRGVQDVQTPPWVQPMPQNVFTPFCTLEGTSCTPGLMLPGCAIAGKAFTYVPSVPGVYPSFCTLEGAWCTADFAMAGCATVSANPEETGPPPPPPDTNSYLLCENGTFLVQQNGGRIIL